jgi:ABC-type antimicrobial peptide transport system permease subunit
MREIGVRLAVGATRGDVVTLLLGESLRPVAGGLIAGVIVALTARRLFQGTLYGVNAYDPVAFTVSALTLLMAAAVSTYIPTRRASRVNPVVVLRQS